jgi:hypothetical protein
MSDEANNHKPLAEPEFIWGAENIGKVIGRSERQVYYLIDSGYLGDAVFRIGDKFVARRSRLLKLLGGRDD